MREEDERADNQMDVLLVAAKKAKIRDYTNLLTNAGLNPVVVDIDVFALENEYEMTASITAPATCGHSASPDNVLVGIS